MGHGLLGLVRGHVVRVARIHREPLDEIGLRPHLRKRCNFPFGSRQRQTEPRVEEINLLVHQRAWDPIAYSLLSALWTDGDGDHAAVDPELIEQREEDECPLV